MKVIQITMEKKLQIHNDTTTLTICTVNLTAQTPHKKGYPLKPESYSDFLKQARLDNCLTQFELSLELSVYSSTIDKWERGATEPNTINKQKIIEFLGYDPMQKSLTI